MRIFALVFSAIISTCVTFRSASGYIRTNGLLRYHHSRLLSAQIDEITHASSDSIRKWFLKTNNRRPEVFISEASTKSAIIADTWKSVLTSLRVLEKDETMKDYTAVFAFPKLSVSSYASPSAAIAEFEKISEAVERHLNESSPLFQPTFKRKVQFHIQPDESGSGPGTLLMSLDTRRVKSTILEYDDIDDYVPPVEDALTNDIENFPFPTVFDFVSGMLHNFLPVYQPHVFIPGYDCVISDL
jgi:hypothetical protein